MLWKIYFVFFHSPIKNRRETTPALRSQIFCTIGKTENSRINFIALLHSVLCTLHSALCTRHFILFNLCLLCATIYKIIAIYLCHPGNYRFNREIKIMIKR